MSRPKQSRIAMNGKIQGMSRRFWLPLEGVVCA
jgi:hypothetical protein